MNKKANVIWMMQEIDGYEVMKHNRNGALWHEMGREPLGNSKKSILECVPIMNRS